MFQFGAFPVLNGQTHKASGCPIRVSPDHRFLASTLSLSQLGITNFYGFAVIDSTTAYVTYRDINGDTNLGILDHSTSIITPIGALGSALGAGNIIYGLDIASDGNLYGVSIGGEVLRLDTTTGLATLISQTGINFRALAAIPDAGVPEPATVALSAIGLALLLFRKRP